MNQSNCVQENRIRISDFSQKIKGSDAPKLAGIYAMFFGAELLYIGQSKNIRARISTHLCIRRTQKKINYLPAERIPLESIRFRIFLCSDMAYRKNIESKLIASKRPPFNVLICQG
jgi:excinuclease UvrABC nuclease subunit